MKNEIDYVKILENNKEFSSALFEHLLKDASDVQMLFKDENIERIYIRELQPDYYVFDFVGGYSEIVYRHNCYCAFGAWWKIVKREDIEYPKNKEYYLYLEMLKRTGFLLEDSDACSMYLANVYRLSDKEALRISELWINNRKDILNNLTNDGWLLFKK